MKPLPIPVRGEWVPGRLRCQKCGEEPRVNARARTPSGNAAVVRYRCPNDHCGEQRVKPDTSRRRCRVRREMEGLRVLPVEVGEETIYRQGYEMKTPEQLASDDGAVIDQ